MFKVDDNVFYKGVGVCRVTDVREVKLGGSVDRLCYVMKPYSDPGSTLYLPVENDETSGLIRPVLTRSGVEELIEHMPEAPALWIDNERERSRDFLARLQSSDSLDLVRLIRTLYVERAHRKEVGKVLGATDTRIMAAAERLLHGEFAFVLSIDLKDVVPFIQHRLSPSV